MARFAFVRCFFSRIKIEIEELACKVCYANETTNECFCIVEILRRDDRCNDDGIKLNVAIKLETVVFAAKEWLIEGKMMERDCFVS